jgi:hypothetical protein
MTVIETLRRKYLALSPTLTERGRRLWAGVEACEIGRGGVAWVARATGLAISTVRIGRDEVRSGEMSSELVRDRKRGGGRRRLESKDPELIAALESLVNPATRGDPESPLRWTCKSLRVLANELTEAKHPVGPSKVGELLRSMGYSLQANSKTKEGDTHPDRNAQFEFINARAQDFLSRGLPVISVDAKKKEVLGERANAGREWQPKGTPIKVKSHDFFDDGGPKATPYGVYDIGRNLAFVNVGTDHNTPTFAARSIEKWWDRMGVELYPDARELLITADAGGSNASKSTVWKASLQRLADRTGVTIHVSHFPPGTSKWNKIEHRLFSFVSANWRGRPLTSYETIVSLIAATRTLKGLRVKAELDLSKYPIGVAVTPDEVARLQLERATFHGEWNYTLRPRTAEQLAAAAQKVAARTVVTHAERRARWKEIVSRQLRSGLSGLAFCAQHGISYSGFVYARSQIVGKIRKTKRTPD